MKLYHLTPKRIYDEHIKQEGLIPQLIDSAFSDGIPDSAVFCWPKYNEQMIKDWIVFNKLKNKQQDDDYVLLKVKVAKKAIFADNDICHTLTVDVNGSHGHTKYTPHTEIPCRLVTDVIPPKNITPILSISTYNAEKFE